MRVDKREFTCEFHQLSCLLKWEQELKLKMIMYFVSSPQLTCHPYPGFTEDSRWYDAVPVKGAPAEKIQIRMRVKMDKPLNLKKMRVSLARRNSDNPSRSFVNLILRNASYCRYMLSQGLKRLEAMEEEIFRSVAGERFSWRFGHTEQPDSEGIFLDVSVYRQEREGLMKVLAGNVEKSSFLSSLLCVQIFIVCDGWSWFANMFQIFCGIIILLRCRFPQYLFPTVIHHIIQHSYHSYKFPFSSYHSSYI